MDLEFTVGPPPEKEAFYFSSVGTLIRYDTSREAVLVNFLEEEGIETTMAVAKIAYLVADDAVPSKGYTVKPKGEREIYWRTYSSALLKNCRVEDPDGKIADALSGRLRSPRIWNAFYDAKPALESLKKLDCLIGVIANAEANLSASLDHAGLSQYIDTVTTSEEAGVEKPDPAIFQKALSKSGIELKSCVYVGDVPEIDILGARNAGITQIWLDRNRLARRLGDIRKIETLTELEYLFPIVPHRKRSE
ncbi:MAG: HAD-IA family hydrolase [Methanomassiliicoccales archaeon]|nr:HAD-IA family hydrolase [Methanomassiliicoccales archaeon]